jgi:hypothetical protein
MVMLRQMRFGKVIMNSTYEAACHSAVRSKAWTVFFLVNTGIVVSNPTRGMDVCPRLFRVYVALCR